MTQNALLGLIALVSAGIAVLGITPVVQYVGVRSGRVDQPDSRKIHKQPVVRIGGAAIFAGVLVSLVITALAGGEETLLREADWGILGVLVGGVAFFTIGFMDDLLSLAPLPRLLLQFGSAGLAWVLGVRIALPPLTFLPFDGASDWLSPLLTAIWLVGIVNALNWIDGLDGLAAGFSGLAATNVGLIALLDGHPAIAILALALAGSTFGFLRYNFNPATIFMGDGGSYLLGYGLASLCVLEFTTEATWGRMLLPLLVLAVPIFDMVYVILTRLRDGRSPFLPDRRHIHHRLLAAGASQRSAAIYIYGLTLLGNSIATAGMGFTWGRLAIVASGGIAIVLSLQLYQQRAIARDLGSGQRG